MVDFRDFQEFFTNLQSRKSAVSSLGNIHTLLSREALMSIPLLGLTLAELIGLGFGIDWNWSELVCYQCIHKPSKVIRWWYP